jgi:hypothetical protein
MRCSGFNHGLILLRFDQEKENERKLAKIANGNMASLDPAEEGGREAGGYAARFVEVLAEMRAVGVAPSADILGLAAAAYTRARGQGQEAMYANFQKIKKNRFDSLYVRVVCDDMAMDVLKCQVPRARAAEKRRRRE